MKYTTKLTNEQQIEVIKRYKNNETATGIAKEIDSTRSIVISFLKNSSEVEYKSRNGNLKKDFFKKIDTEEKAYWLGFAWSDGNVNVRQAKGWVDYCFNVDLCELDHEHLYKLKNSLGASNKVEKLKTVKASLTNDKWRYRLRIKNKEFCKVLLDEYGMVPYRTDTTKLLNRVPDYLFRHFIRGVLDADGSISFVKDKTINIQIMSVESLAAAIREDLFAKKISTGAPKLHKPYEGGLVDVYRLVYGGNTQGIKILHYLYDGATIYLERKYQKALTIMQTIEGEY